MAPVLVQRRVGHRQGAGRARHPRGAARAARSRSSRSTAAPFPSSCSRPSSSATARARSPAPTTTARASSRRRNGGTLFLDEIGDLPLSMQSQAAARDPGALGAAGRRGRAKRRSTCASLSATHKDLGAEVQAGRFRQDLYYRLNVIQIRVPPLRERLEDLPAICERVLERIARDAGVSPPPRLTRDALVHLARYRVPGQRARAREPAAPRGRAVGRRGARRLRPRPARVGVHRQRRAGARPRCRRAQRRPSARRRRRSAAGRGSRCRATWPRYLDERRARHPGARARAASLQPHRGRRAASACRCARCATAWRAWASQRRRRRRAGRPRATPDARPRGSGSDGWWRFARRAATRRTSAPRPGRRRGRPGRAPLDQPAAGRVRRRRDRAPVHQPARLGRASVLRSRSAACEVSAHFFVRRDGELLQFVSCDERAWHAGASRWRGRDELQRLSRSASSSKASKASASKPRSTRRWPRCCARSRSAIRSRAVAGHEHVAPGRKHDPGAGFDWARAAARAGAGRAMFPDGRAASHDVCKRAASRAPLARMRRRSRHAFVT